MIPTNQKRSFVFESKAPFSLETVSREGARERERENMSSFTRRRGDTSTRKENRPINQGGVGVSKKLTTKGVLEDGLNRPGRKAVGRTSGAVPGLAQKKLVLKPLNKAKDKVLSKPLPFITKTNLYDEHWATKQERGFTKWLNFILAPTDQYGNIITPQGKTAGYPAPLEFDSSTRVKSPLTTPLDLLRKRRLSIWRQSACCLFQSEPCTRVFERLEIEIETGRLAIREDHSPHSDVGAREELLQLLMCYNPIWLKLGLEAMFGEMIVVPPQHNIPQTLTLYIQSRLLANNQIAEMYYQPNVTGHYGKGYNDAVCQFILKRFLQLVLLLDKAKLTRLIDHDPCLFTKEASVKSSREVLWSFCRYFLSGEGDITKHLHHLGYSVSHVQSPLHEFDYTVKNLATDLQDGLRLTRLVELLSENWGLSKQLRVPAATKMQKVHNVEACLSSLRGLLRLPSTVSPQSIVEGHREKTLTLLWSLIFHFKVKVAVNQKELKKEIEFLEHQKRHPIAYRFSNCHCSSIEASIFFQSPELSLLLDWCRAVCALYGVPVNNFSTSFSDGRAFCYLLHHYLPSLLPLEAIGNETTLSSPTTIHPASPEQEENYGASWTATFSPTTGVDKKREALLATEKANFTLLTQKLPLLGGVPLMIHSRDMSNTMPDEKVVITCVTYMCQQLMLLRRETRAAICIQRTWRRYAGQKKEQRRKAIQARQKRKMAVLVVQTRWRAHKQMKQQREAFVTLRTATATLQRAFRQWHKARQHKAATLLQATVRSWIARRKYLKQREAIIIAQKRLREILLQKRRSEAASCIQAFYRGYRQRKHYATILSAVAVLQAHFKAYVLGKRAREAYYVKQRACLVLHRVVRNWLAYRAHQKAAAATVIQAGFRGYRERKRYVVLRRAAVVLQRHLKATLAAKKQQKAYLVVRQATVQIQAQFRRWQVQKMVRRQQSAAIVIQASVRGFLAYRHYLIFRQSVLTLQVYTRATLAAMQQKRTYQRLREATITLQSHVRRWQVQRQLSNQHSAAVVIQAKVRSYLARKNYLIIRHSTLVLQAHVRATQSMKHQKKNYQLLKQATITLQSHIRRWQVQRQLSQQHSAAMTIQSFTRGFLVHKQYITIKQSALVLQIRLRAIQSMRQQREAYLTLRRATITIQSLFRRWRVQREISVQHSAAVVMQASIRGYLARKKFLRIRRSTQILQKHLQATISARHQRREFLMMRQAAIVLQSHVRRWRVQRELVVKQKAAVLIQACFRSHQQRQIFLQLRQAAVCLQHQWRAQVAMKRKRAAYEKLKGATITIQAHTRGFLARRNYRIAQNACRILQAHVRGYLIHRRYQQQRQAATILQAATRCFIAKRKYHQQKDAIVLLQSYSRGWLARRKVRLELQHISAAVRIQAAWRGSRTHRIYQRLQRSSIVIQSAWRSFSTQRTYREMRRAAICIQSHVRRCQVKRKLTQMHGAATTIQASTRSFLARKRYLQQRKAAITIQSSFRKHQANKYRNAATLLQANWRRFRDRRWYITQRDSAVIIQSYYRMYQTRRSYTELCRAAVVLQTATRAYLARQEHRRRMSAVLVIQSAWRAWYNRRQQAAVRLQASARTFLAVRSYQKKRRAAVVIQSHLRCYWAHQAYLMFRNKVIKIQAAWRACQQRRRYLLILTSATTIQHKWRACLCARETRKEFLVLKKAALTIQKVFRGFLVRRMMQKWHLSAVTIQNAYRQRLLLLHNSATLIQAAYHCHTTRQTYLMKRRAAMVIQTHYRATIQARRQHQMYLITRRAIIKAQAIARGWLARHHYSTTRSAVITLQKNFRMWHAARKFMAIRTATLFLQRHSRGMLARRHFNHLCEQHHRNIAATLIQTQVRGYLARQCYQQQRAAVTVLQKHIRGCLVRREFRHTMESVVKLQSQVRGLVTRRRYLRIRTATSLLQQRTRAMLLARQSRTWYLELRRSTIMIQAAVRGWQAQKRYNEVQIVTLRIQQWYRYRQAVRAVRVEVKRRHFASTVIQTAYRAHNQRTQYLTMKKSAVIIQSAYRSHVAHKRYCQLQNAAITIQQHWRATLQTRTLSCYYQSMRNAAILIQHSYRAWRMCQQQRREYVALRNAAITLQRTYRLQQQRRKLRAIVCLQQAMRRILACRRQARRQAYLTQFSMVAHRHLCVVRLQRWWRHQVARRVYRTQLRQVVLVQSAVRGWLARSSYHRLQSSTHLIQRMARGMMVRQRMRKMRSSALVIQSAWRGWCVRKQVKSKAVKSARERIAKANAAAQQQMKLWSRLPSMLDILQHCTYLSTVVDVLKSIELMTSVSERCSLAVVQANATLTLYEYISRANRSRPALKVANICVTILLNLSKWRSTSADMLTECNSLSTLVDFMTKVHLTQPDFMLPSCKLLLSYKQLSHAQPFPERCFKKLSSMRTALGKMKQRTGRSQSSSSNLHQCCYEYLQNIL